MPASADQLLDAAGRADDLLDAVRPRTADELLDDAATAASARDEALNAANDETQRALIGLSRSMADFPTRSERKRMLAGEQADVAAAPAPSVLAPSPATLTKHPAVTFGNVMGSLLKGINTLLVPNLGDPENNIPPVSPSRAREYEEQLPLYKLGDWFQGKAADILDTVPETERETVAGQLTDTVSSLALLASQPHAAPVLFGLTKTGEVYDTAYHQALEDGASRDEAALQAGNKALLSGAKEVAIWQFGPKALNKFVGERIARTAGTSAASRWLALTAQQGVSVGGTAAASTAAQNVIEGRPVGEDVGTEFVAGAVLPRLMHPTALGAPGRGEIPFSREVHDFLDRFTVKPGAKTPAPAPIPPRRAPLSPRRAPLREGGEPLKEVEPAARVEEPVAPAPVVTPVQTDKLGEATAEIEQARLQNKADVAAAEAEIAQRQAESDARVAELTPTETNPPTADELLDTVAPREEPTSEATNERTGQPRENPPGVDVREPAGTGETTAPEPTTETTPRPEDATSPTAGGPAQGAMGDDGGRSLPGGDGKRARPERRPGPERQPAATAPVEGAGSGVSESGAVETAQARWRAIESTYIRAKAATEALPGVPLEDIQLISIYKKPDRHTAVHEEFVHRDNLQARLVELDQQFPSAEYSQGIQPSQKPYGPRKGEPTYKQWLAGARPTFEQPTAAAQESRAPTAADVNHILPAGEDWIPSGDKAKVRANLDAIKLLKQLEAENRNPTPEEKAALARYTGWGGLKEIFDEGKAAYRDRPPWSDEQKREAANWEKAWGKLYDETKTTLTPEEHDAAARSILNAHYTSREIINKLWQGVQRLGFKGGAALEPAAGVGHFIGLMPEGLRDKTRWSAVELDSISGRIAQKLYPQARVQNTGFEESRIAPNSQDLVISNVPFAQGGPIDKRYPRFSLHNYFFARALDLVKPGGIVAAITSDSTMDSGSSAAARKYFAERADLVGAIRLPNTAFKKNAGTEVTTDILFFRKKDGGASVPASQPFTRTVPAETYKGEPITINEYFAAHPEMMLGRMSKEGTMYRAEQQALLPTPGADLSRQLDEAIARLPENIMGSAAVSVGPAAAPELAGKNAKLGALTLNKGVPMVVAADGTLEKPDWSGDPKKVRQAVDYVATRDAASDLIRKQLSTDSTEAELAEGRKALNQAYDAYRKKYGAINDRKSSFLDDDVDFPLALALEDGVTKLVGDRRLTEFVKSRIFTERTIFPRVPPQHVDTVPDALQVSQNFAGKVDPDYIAKLTGKPLDAVKSELETSGAAFENPATGQWENRATYLSGFVKKKLAAAEAAAESDPRYQRHVAELEKVQPPPIAIENIGVKLGSVFVPPSVIENFLRVTLDVDTKVNFTPETGDWNIAPRSGWQDSKNITIYGIHGWKGHELVEQSLNLKSANVIEEYTEGGVKKTRKLPGPTLEAQQKQDQLQKLFKDYVKGSPETARLIEQIYNDKYNGVVAPKFEAPTWAHYPGASNVKTLRPHQKAVVTRMLQNSTLLAHAVGTGKTLAMTTAAMEMRRLGLAKKPMIVVQNATLEQFAAAFKSQYPTARILVPNAKQRDAQNRNRTMSRIATGDWDAVIIPQSFVNMLPDDPVRESGYIRDRMDELESAKIEAAAAEGKRSPKASDLQKAIDRLEKRLKELADRKVDNVLTFEQLGVDALFVDEAHAYKKLEFSTKMDNIKGLDTGASQRGWSMSMKTRWVQEKNQGRNVIFATGTPVSNTIAEAWNMMRYVRPDVLKEYGIEKFDDFASTFGDTVTQLEMTPGGTWKPVTRFARYTNGPELIAAWRTVADVVTPEEVNLPGLPSLKNGKTSVHNIPQSPALKKYVEFLRSELERFAKMSGKEKRENSHIPLVVFGLAKKASLDMRMIDPSLPDQPGSKLNVAADAIAQIYRDSTSVKGAQMVFSDAFQDNPDSPRFNLYQEMKAKLVARGVPAEQIAIITADIKDAKREALFKKVNDGDLRIVLGSTERMGVGVNAQEHLIALHHLDAPPRPMDIEQRNGRIIRQGNQNPEVEVHSYGVENTLDAAMFQKLATKQKFINQILRGDLQGRSFEDAANEQSLSFEEQMAAFSGDKRAMEKVALENQVRQLEMLRSGHFDQLRKARDTIAQLNEHTIPYQTRAAADAARRAKEFEASFPAGGDYTLTVGDKTITGRKEVAASLDRVFKEGIKQTLENGRKENAFGDYTWELGTAKLNGQTIQFTGRAGASAEGIIDPDQVSVMWKFVDGGAGGQSTTGAGFFHSLAASLECIAGEPDHTARSLANEQRNLRELTGFVQQPFERESELEQSRTKLAQLTAELEAEGKEQPKGETTHEMVVTASGREPTVAQYVKLMTRREDIIGELRAPPGWRIVDIATSKWDSVYWIAEDPEGNSYKVRVSNHDSKPNAHGPNDYEVDMPKNYTLAQFRAAMKAAEKWLWKTAGENPVDFASRQSNIPAWQETEHAMSSSSGAPGGRGPRGIPARPRPTETLTGKATRESSSSANAPSDSTPIDAGAMQSWLAGRSAATPAPRVDPEVEHGFSGRTSVVKAAVEDLARVRNMVAPQTAGGSARFAGNLLRELNAKMANELARADESLRKFRRDFDRTPVNLKKFKYDSTLPLPRNLAFIDAYESGVLTALSPLDQLAAGELHKLNTADVARVQALGTGALTTFYQNYFPHIWDNPKLAASVFGKILGHSPLEGPKAFLKQRTHKLFADGLAAGLKPVHDNPIDLWLLKKREIERYILAHEFTRQMKDVGLMKFKYAFSKSPDGWTPVNDAAFSVYGPPTVTVKEAFDAGMREATLQLLQDLGVPHQRLTRIGGQRWGYEREQTGVPGSERIVTKFAGPDFVIWHELGHVLDNRFPDFRRLFDSFPHDAPINQELRALADLRTDPTSSASFKRNVRTWPEKMAVIVQAYVHAPELMHKVAPTVKTAFENFIKSHPELEPVNNIRPGLRLGVGEAELSHGGLLKLGDYVMPDAAARVVNNFLSPGLNPHLWYRSLRQTSNLLNSVQLGLSAFHLGFTSVDAATSRLAVAIEDAVRGKVGSALATAATVPVSPFTNVRTGAQLRAEVLRPGTHPELAELAKALERAGGRVGMDAFWQTEFTRRLMRAWHEGGLQWGTLPIRLPLAVWEQTMRPILEYIVPRQKLGVFADMARRELQRLGPAATEADTREALRKAWDSVDNRMGQVVYDNLFYNRTVKDVALLAFRAYGWQLGKYREGLGAVVDTARAAGNLLRGQPGEAEFTHRMAYIIALPLMVGTLGGMLHYLLTGRKPDEAKDYFMPRTGETDRNGNAVRMNLPSYVKDAIAYSKHPVTSFQHSLNPLGAAMMDLLQNEDFYSTEIRHPDDPLWKQGGDVALFAAKQFVPFSVSGAQKLREDAAPAWKQVAPFFGITPVPQRLTMTPAQEFAADTMSKMMPSMPRTKEQFDRSQLLKDIIQQIKSGKDGPDWVNDLAEGLDRHALAPNTAEIMLQRLKYTPFQFQVSHLSPDYAVKAYVLSTPEERAQIEPIIIAKLARARTLWPEEKAALLQKMVDTARAESNTASTRN